MKIDERLYFLLKTHGPLTRKEICEWLGCAWSTAYDALERLRLKNDVIRVPQPPKGRGQPVVKWQVNN